MTIVRPGLATFQVPDFEGERGYQLLLTAIVNQMGGYVTITQAELFEANKILVGNRITIVSHKPPSSSPPSDIILKVKIND